ncbi:MAG: alpha/beta hydrolase [Flavobacteriales bacterium]|nr:alpha/beta hydrolase [Flavobacteriales bacterium]
MEVQSIHKYNLDVRTYKAKLPIQGKILLCHGFGIYKERYEKLINQFQNSGFEVWAYDHCGHGLSNGQFEKVTNGKQLSEDFHTVFTKFLEVGIKEGKTFVYAHSMGGNIVARYFLEHSNTCDGIILCAPMFGIQFNPSLMKLGLMKKAIDYGFDMSSFFFAPKILSSDESVLEEFLRDNDIHTNMSFRLLFSLLRNGKLLTNEKLPIPTYLVWGDRDQFVDLEMLDRFSGINRIQPLILSRMHHEPFCEPNSDKLHQPILNWMLSL